MSTFSGGRKRKEREKKEKKKRKKEEENERERHVLGRGTFLNKPLHCLALHCPVTATRGTASTQKSSLVARRSSSSNSIPD